MEKPQPSGASLGLGIASLVVGVLSFLLGLIPCVGIIGVPFAVLGLVLGVAGGVIAMTRQGAGIAFPIAGSAVNLVAVLVTITWFMGAKYLAGEATQNMANQMQQTLQDIEVQEQVDTPLVFDEDPADPAEWVDASKPVDVGDVRVKVVRVQVGSVSLTNNAGRQLPTKKPQLTIVLSLTNQSKMQEVHYRSWGHFLVHDSTIAKDSAGRVLGRVQFGLMQPVGRAEAMPILQPGVSIQDVVVFTKPMPGFKHVRLSLPAKNVGGQGYVRFQIPASMVQQ